jgi:hypothetical protein
MSKKLEKILELLINEQQQEAEEMLHEWFVENAKKIHQTIIEEDNMSWSRNNNEA